MSAIIARCRCGAQYKVAAEVLGRRFKCRKCGDVFEVRGAEKSAAAPSPLSPKRKPDPAPSTPSLAAAPAPPPAVPAPAPEEAVTYATVSAADSPTAPGPLGFLPLLLKSFLFLQPLGNTVTFMMIWAALVAGTIAGERMIAHHRYATLGAGLVLLFWAEISFAVFSFNAIRLAAEGDRDLPSFPWAIGADEAWEVFYRPFFTFVGTTLLALAPAVFGFLIFKRASTLGSAINPVGAWFTIGGLAVLGLFAWPMLILCAAMGEIHAFLRIGRMISVLAQSLAAYCCTVLTVYLSAAACVAIMVWLDRRNISGVVITILALGLRAFLQTGAMRAVGAYYCRYRASLVWMSE